ncbi:MAG: transporter [Methanobrevibacter thaueri]|nr:transporter [Methanobrevibacter thaueri]
MDMMSVLWQVGIFASVIVFGIKIGLASGLANLSKKLFAIICIAYGGGVVLISAIASLYSEQLIQAIYSYNTIFYILMASIMIIAGLFTIREWKIHDKNTSTATSLAIIAPCPCCFGSIIASVLIVAPTIGVSSLDLSWYAAAALVAVMLVTYFTSNTIVRIINRPYPIVLGNFMLLLGAYFLLSAIVIPNIAGVMSKTNAPITMSSPQDILMIIVAFAVLLFGGMILTKRGRNILE